MFWLVVLNILHFPPYLGKWSNLTNIFQMGWNHQLDVAFEIDVSLFNLLGSFGCWCFLLPAGSFQTLQVTLRPFPMDFFPEAPQWHIMCQHVFLVNHGPLVVCTTKPKDFCVSAVFFWGAPLCGKQQVVTSKFWPTGRWVEWFYLA